MMVGLEFLQLASMSFAGCEWTRPAGFLALVVPLIVVLFASRRRPPREVPTGAFALWKAVAAEASSSSKARKRGLPRQLWWLVLALVLTALAIAGPRRLVAQASAPWTIVLDRSPSMYLPLGPGGAEPRLVHGVREAQAWLDELGVPPQARSWTDGERSAPRGTGPPAEFLSAPLAPAPPPSWARFDGPGRLWISDAEPQPAASAASVLLVGGAAIPGEVGGGLAWDGARLAPSSGATRGGVFASELPPVVQELLSLWCEERGLEFTSDERAARLRVYGLHPGAPEVSSHGRDGWRARGAWQPGGAPRSDEWGRLEEWLAPQLVTSAAGRIHIACEGTMELSGDPAAFAVSWSKLFDERCSPAPGVVALAERRAAGPARRSLGAPAPGSPARQDEAAWEAWLLLAAFSCASLWALSSLRARAQ